MKTTPVGQGGTPVGHANAMATHKDRYSERITSKPQQYTTANIGPEAANCIPGTNWRDRPARTASGNRTQSRSQETPSQRQDMGKPSKSQRPEY